MAKAIGKSVPDSTTIGAFKLTVGGLKVEGNPTFHQWEAAVIEAKALGVCLMWVIGDLLCYGEEKYGERYTQALEIADYADETVRQAQRIARQFPPDIRLTSVPFSFHRTVAPLPQKKALSLLKKAGEEGWTRAVLAVEVQKIRNPEKADEVAGNRVPESEPEEPAELEQDDDPVVIDGDPKKCLEAVAGMAKTLKKWRALFSSLMASPYADLVRNAAGGYSDCKPFKTGERIEHGKLGPIAFGPLEYTTKQIDELLAFGGGLKAMFTRLERPEVAGAGVAEWEAEA